MRYSRIDRGGGGGRTGRGGVGGSWLWTVIAVMSSMISVSSALSFTTINGTSNGGNAADPATALSLKSMRSAMALGVTVDPLTTQAGAGMSSNQLKSINVNGTLVLINTRNYLNVLGDDIAYMNCDNATYEAGNIDAPQVFSTVASHHPAGIVLYSTVSDRCHIVGSAGFDFVFTMTDRANATRVESELQTSPLAQAVISQGTNLPARPSSNNGTKSNPGGAGTNNGNILGPSPTTAVAMIILYSITGVITALFLIIIISGAVRAHRHPERYGPRRGRGGQTRQSRAKGIARAMLETIPIVKFGDNEADKPQESTQATANRDVELGEQTAHREQEETTRETEDADADEIRPEQPAHSHEQPREDSPSRKPAEAEGHEQATAAPTTTADAGEASKTSTTQAPAAAGVTIDGASRDDGLGCSICTEDFVKGQDIRVLPCNHKYHPECVDPWLLNVSGTCPLCRIDLRPKPENKGEGEEGGNGDADGPSGPDGVAAAEGRGAGGDSEARRASRRVSFFSRMGTSGSVSGVTSHLGLSTDSQPEERIAALLQLREERRRRAAQGSVPEEAEPTATAGAPESSNPSDTPEREGRRRRRFSSILHPFSSRRRAETEAEQGATEPEPSTRQNSHSQSQSRRRSSRIDDGLTEEEREELARNRSRRGTYAE